ncbi:MAG: glycosyltransferase family 4 protein [Bacteroidetes bacterium]|nr:glycosyltransferase family 4 protein [Bacteroidota bacterium]
MKTAIVHDWFAGYAGSERVVESLTNVWKDADVYVLFNLLTSEEQKIVVKDKIPFTSFLQNWKSVRRNHRKYLPLFPYAIEQFDLSKYDLIISSSHAVAKGVLTNSNQLHINYCHTPIRYAWDLTHQYLNEANLTSGIKGMAAKAILHYIRMWDVSAANRVDHFVANSNYIAGRIKKIYRRDSEVIYPPVDTSNFPLETKKENFYLTASRLVPYKRIDLIAEAFSKMTDKKLIIIGEGPEAEKIKLKSAMNVEFLGYQSGEKLREYMQKAKAFVFAADEDFGIMVIEALSCGTPVIALNKGGTAETMIDNKTGILFDNQNPESIIDAVQRFESAQNNFDPSALSEYAKKFDRKIFEERIKEFVESKSKEFFSR